MRLTNRASRIWLASVVCSIGAASVLTLAACGSNPASPSAVSGANLVVRLTDDPIDDVEQVNIFFISVTVKPEGKPVEELTLTLTENPIDLLKLADTVINLAAGVVEPGTYEFMHINIDGRRSGLVESGVQKSLQIPSEEVKVLGRFMVDPDHTTTLTLDFDARDSLLRLGNGDWLLRPVIVITGNNQSSQE